ncbi:Kelch repeat-containing protein [Plebeiibacterium marinum]|uniref:Galactose oxidase n=1 Tax=Plebeiibacterium marinum TaxID=2992111 RepID=A0AAE3MCP8_9BACT|nr:kelch repeat-containing protein [Plebeiobacterium marinum]MCW3805109.1 galactose oxidase [Plebeiobacterium marinum]
MLKQSIFFISALLMGSLCFTSCSDDDDDYLGNWVEYGDFSGKVRSDAVSFTIGDDVYVGTGYDYDDDEKFNDFWKLRISGTPETQISIQWTQIEDLPGVARNRAVAFATDTKGYVGTGSDEDDAKLKDFYEYDPATGWTQKSDFKGTARRGATAFCLDNIGYVGTGEDDDENKSDFFSYNPSTDTWTAISNVPKKRRFAMSFVLDGKAYLLSGFDNGTSHDDFYEYDVANNAWVAKRRISDYTDSGYDDDYDYDIQRYSAVVFTMDGKAYLATGSQGGLTNQTWEWDPMTDTWDQKTDFEGAARSGAIAFTVNNVGWVATGGNGSYSFDDMWYFEPDEEYENKD